MFTRPLSLPFKLTTLASVTALFLGTMIIYAGTARGAKAYTLADVASVLELKNGDETEYFIVLDDDTGHIVKGRNISTNKFNELITNTGFTGDADDIIDMARRANADDVEVRQLRIKLLQVLLARVQEQYRLLREQNGANVTDVSYLGSAPWCTIRWSRPLMLGSEGEDVVVLQKFLNAVPGISIAQSGPGSPGAESSYFGPMTVAALNTFQEMHADEILHPLKEQAGTGYFGALTQSWIERYCSGAVGADAPTTITLDKLNRQSGSSECFSEQTAFAEGTRANGYRAPNGLYVSIKDGYFRCEAGQWTPHELGE